VARVMDESYVGAHPPSGAFDIFEIGNPVLGAQPGRRFASGIKHGEVALEPQPIVPAAPLAPADQVGGAVEPIAHQPDAGLFGQPAGDRIEQRPKSALPSASSTACSTSDVRSTSVPRDFH
jgi:hypothetical protein